jgi:hypothetical protein
MANSSGFSATGELYGGNHAVLRMIVAKICRQSARYVAVEKPELPN